MAIIPPAPADVWSCKLLVSLRERSTPEDGAAEKAAALIQTAGPLADLAIAGPFKHYTLHNRDHSKKILHLSEFLMAEQTLRDLSVLDILLIVYAAYLHDLGMSVTETERERILQSPEFSEVAQGWEELWEALADARSRLQTAKTEERFPIEAEIFQLQEAALAAYLRPRHAAPEKYRALIKSLEAQTNRHDLFEFRGVSFEDLLVDVCASHNLDVGVLAEAKGPYEDRFPRRHAVGGAYLNAQFCAAVLRLADIMDFDRERTPRVLFESLGIESASLPGAEISLREWQKHMAVHTLEINVDEIVVSGDSHHPAIEKTVREFCQIIEREIRDTLAVLKKNEVAIAERYQIELPISVRPHIHSVGYVYRDMSLSMNQSRIMSLLMGDRLYSTPAVAIRELIQNAIDACALRQQFEERDYKPAIAVSVATDERGRRWIEVSDNGSGMDEHVLNDYFLKLGSSYYSSPELGQLLRSAGRAPTSFAPISRFGIGLVSSFLIGDLLEVRTRSAHSPRRDHQGRALRIEKLGALVFVTNAESAPDGTLVRLRLLTKFNDNFDQFAKQASDYIRATVIRPRFPIDFRLAVPPVTLQSRPGFVLKATAHDALDRTGMEFVTLELSRWSDRFSGRVGIPFKKTEQGKLSHLSEKRYLRVGAGVDPATFLDDFPGNRVTVNGFTMNIRKIGRVLGGGKNRFALLLDIDIRGDDKVQYDISRDRIVGNGATIVKTALAETICKGLVDTGVMARLDPQTRSVVDEEFRARDSEKKFRGTTEGREFVEQVLSLIPGREWPQREIVNEIGSKLEAKEYLVRDAIAFLKRSGRISGGPDGDGKKTGEGT